MVADAMLQRVVMTVDLARVPAEEVGRAGLVDIGDDGFRVAHRLAEPDQPLVAVQAQPDEVGELGALDRLDGGDLHRGGPFPRSRL